MLVIASDGQDQWLYDMTKFILQLPRHFSSPYFTACKCDGSDKFPAAYTRTYALAVHLGGHCVSSAEADVAEKMVLPPTSNHERVEGILAADEAVEVSRCSGRQER